MRSVNEVFKLLVENGTYAQASYLMCIALTYALRSMVITTEEYAACNDAISVYSRHLSPTTTTHSLYGDLINAGLTDRKADKAFEDASSVPVKYLLRERYCKSIYLNWDNRPKLTFKERLCALCLKFLR